VAGRPTDSHADRNYGGAGRARAGHGRVSRLQRPASRTAGRFFSIRPDGSDRQRVVDPGREPAVSADGRTLVFQRGRNLYIANRSGGDVRQVTDTPEAELTPSFSPSGNKILYATDRTIDNPAQIYTVRVDGSDRTRLTQGESSSDQPEYSPNGNRTSSPAGVAHLICRS
jgi:Tol biopolymer transport system component